MFFRVNISLMLVLVGSLLLGIGCATLFPPPAPVKVNDSQLNWLNIRYRPVSKTRPPCRIEIVGAGYLHFIQGESPRVSDDFAIDTEHRDWANVSEEKLGMTPDQTRQMLQQFVDAGILKEPPQPRQSDPKAPGIAVFRWSINNRKGACITDNPDLTDLVETLVRQINRKGI